MEAVLSGQSVNLFCSVLLNTRENSDLCSGKHRVYWYRAGSESHPHLIYTTSSSCDVQKGMRCIYNLTQTIRGLSDSGVYYCAVVTCGEILFGEGTKVQISMLAVFHLFMIKPHMFEVFKSKLCFNNKQLMVFADD